MENWLDHVRVNGAFETNHNIIVYSDRKGKTIIADLPRAFDNSRLALAVLDIGRSQNPAVNFQHVSTSFEAHRFQEVVTIQPGNFIRLEK